MTQTASNPDALYFYEEVMLLALREDDGRIEGKAQFEYQHMLSAALLAELAMLERITVADDKKHIIDLCSSKPIGDELLDAALDKIIKNKPKSTSYWITALQNIKNLRGKAAARLCQRRILAAEDGKIFFFFDKTYYPELNPRPEQRLVARLEAAIFSDATDIDERTIVLLALLRKSELLKIPFDAKALKERRHRMKDICEGNIIGQSAHKALEAAKTAVMVAAIMPAISASVVSS